MVQISPVPQLNKIRILFNSPSLYTHIYPYTTVYHCIPCIHSTAYPLHLPLKPDYHTMHKRIQAHTSAHTLHRIRPLYTPAPTHKRRSADVLCQIMHGKAQKKCGYRAILYALYMVYIPLPTTKKHRKKSLS